MDIDINTVDADLLRHHIGNPVFAIETNLISLRARLHTGKVEEASLIVDEIQKSIERLKIVLSEL